ncbi:MAG: Asp-tRNA(Asn)/Glu-tRNA(Gln) amidotransferase subunit GatB [Spirochaetes bacterium]|nr:Asp-tRNA(Asn)/Glu-tRNA(Gln) amidotransferase subunit GatB [Spirochaetota bacterium]
MKFIPTIGLEVHCQLNTQSKLFSPAATSFGADANTEVQTVCLGLPGALPVLNREAVTKAVKAGLAVEGLIHERSKFDRKNYFYPDLPKGYQITQFFEPYCTKGKIEIAIEGGKKTIRITRIHIEEDAGKLMHSEDPAVHESYVDLNRAGTPLIEIVSEPDIANSDEAVLYLTELKKILEYVDVSDCNMEQGSLRVDANVSVRPEGTEKLGTRVEIKNLNSFKSVKAAIEYEIRRQSEVIEEGGKIVQETRLYNAARDVTAAMRSKEEAHDYRYFPDPDLVPLILKREAIEGIRKELPELAHQKRARYVSEFGLPEYDAGVLTAERETALYFEDVIRAGAPAKKASNWVMVEMLAIVKEQHKQIGSLFPPTNLAELIHLIDSGMISGKIAKDVFAEMVQSGKKAKAIVEEKGMAQISDAGAIREIVLAVMAEHPSSVADFKAGKDRALKHLQGEIMKKTRGKVNPQVANQLLGEELAR